ncbi:hypothetical protein CLCR_03767 [Cladophialophora carrionii]|uniref:Uncharacterized protein n=1 Tax=Cladophialophora carrionii TaxID=86049 RepID=A0A1C1CG48_9EURO|nr:hypothetical protein CLCR_03767 [Cladophialophora carrionii]
MTLLAVPRETVTLEDRRVFQVDVKHVLEEKKSNMAAKMSEDEQETKAPQQDGEKCEETDLDVVHQRRRRETELALSQSHAQRRHRK